MGIIMIFLTLNYFSFFSKKVNILRQFESGPMVYEEREKRSNSTHTNTEAKYKTRGWQPLGR